MNTVLGPKGRSSTYKQVDRVNNVGCRHALATSAMTALSVIQLLQ